MAAPSFLNAGSGNFSAAATSRTPGLPASRANGNVLLCVCVSKNNTTHAITGAGWAAVPGFSQFAVANMTVSLWYCIVDGSEGTPTISWSGSVACGAQIIQYTRAVEASPAPFGTIGTKNNGATATHTSTGFNTTRANSLAIYFDLTIANTAVSTPSGWTEQFDAGSGPAAIRIAGGAKSVATSGTGTGSISLTGAGSQWLQFQLELLEPVVADSVYRGAQAWSSFYKGTRTDSQLYKGTKTLHL